MSELITDIKVLQNETLKNLKSSKAANTVRAYKSDFDDFELFCVKNSFKNLPSEPKIVSLYLTYLASKNIKISTIKRRLVSIGLIHKIKGYYLDTKHPVIIENLMGIRRRKGTYQKAKKPLLINNLKHIIDVINKQNDPDIKKIRNKALLLLGFSGGFRRNELVSINHEDIEFVFEGLKIRLKNSKTDQFGEGFTKGIPHFENSIYCPVSTLKTWINMSKIKKGPLFTRFSKGSKITNIRLSNQSVALIIKDYLSKAGIDNQNYSGHSLRSGFATSAAEAGAEERSIMAITGHKSTEMVRRYIKEANLFKNNALNKIKF
ncbi:tyrosine-type recombinase/integrase [Pelagibacterales bacterium SAG-MED28]|nr:tyrosine-type recombinase/integrase [Pelagibacterales bacterium SAG-MED28]|tara:strand:+ start:56 stop:1012 length:957 start_codon:yes stop_codon:yes gene_type:complete